MGSTVKAVIVVVIAVLAGGGAYALFHKPAADAGTQTATPADTSVAPSPSAAVAATITFTDSGFSPNATTVKAGDTVRVTNRSGQLLDFDSDPHPEHTDNPELNAGDISPGESKMFTVTKTGRWGFHDHLNPGMTGTLNVE